MRNPLSAANSWLVGRWHGPPLITLGTLTLVGLCGLAVGSALGTCNYFFAPHLGDFFPVSGLSLPLSIYGLYASVPAALGAVVLFVEGVRTRRAMRRMLLPLSTCCGLAAGFGIGTIAAHFDWERLKQRRVAEAIEYCDTLRPALERHRRENGRYPARLNDLAGTSPKPLLVRTGDLVYSTRETQFEMRINTSRGLAFEGAWFDSDVAEWQYAWID